LLTLHPNAAASSPARALPADLPAATVWLDLLDGTDAEKAYVERSTGLRVPTREDLREIESSSRLVAEGDVLTLSMPIIAGGKHGASTVSPLGLGPVSP
jgi:magnesium transporter